MSGLVSALVVYVLVVQFEGTAETQRWKIFVLGVGIGLLYAAVAQLIGGFVGLGVGCAVASAALAVLLVTWLGLARPVAFKVAGIYLGIALAVNLAAVWWLQAS